MTGDESARKEWKHYWRNVVKRYQVIIKGWPDNIPFRNLSETSNSLSNLETLYRKWCCGRIYWKKLSSQELQDLDLQRNHQIEQGEAEAPAPRRRRSDFGKKRSRSKGTGSSTQKKHRKSRKIISDEENSEEDSEEDSDGEAARTQKRHRKPTERATTAGPSADEETAGQHRNPTAPADACSRSTITNPPVAPTVPNSTQPATSQPDNTTGIVLSASPAAIAVSCT